MSNFDNAWLQNGTGAHETPLHGIGIVVASRCFTELSQMCDSYSMI